MALINFKQIKGGSDLVTKVNSLASLITNNTSAIQQLNNVVFPVKEIIANTSATAVTEFTLNNTPNTQLVECVINGIEYLENKEFTIDRDNKKFTWTFNTVNGGFDLIAEDADELRLQYYSGVTIDTANASNVRILRSDSLPSSTDINQYNVGDIIFKITPTSYESIGWICNEAGTGASAKWLEFSMVAITDAISVEDENE